MKGNRTSLNVYTDLLFPFLFFTPILISANSCSLVSWLLSLTSASLTLYSKSSWETTGKSLVHRASSWGSCPLPVKSPNKVKGHRQFSLPRSPPPYQIFLFKTRKQTWGGRIGSGSHLRKGKFITANSINSVTTDCKFLSQACLLEPILVDNPHAGPHTFSSYTKCGLRQKNILSKIWTKDNYTKSQNKTKQKNSYKLKLRNAF